MDYRYSLRFWLIVVAVFIAVGSLYVSHVLVGDLYKEEQSRMEVWAEAMQSLRIADEQTDLSMALKVLNANHTIPVMVVDKQHTIQFYRNIRVTGSDSIASLRRQLDKMRTGGQCIRLRLDEQGDDTLDVYYAPSLLLTRLSVYPYIQLGVVLLFVSIALFALLSAKKAEQNRVWVGLSKETAHQLGTPISSLMAWTELLRGQYPDDRLLPAMGEDVERLRLIANRFSQIGSAPELRETDLQALVSRAVDYVARRTSSKVVIRLDLPEEGLPTVRLNESLFEWVVENLCKNAVDAMNGVGTLTIRVGQTAAVWFLDVTDTGKGIDRRHYRDVFKPGYTTKERGWGLGLSLARRIVEVYHNGRIFVLHSEPGRGTTFRVELRR
ncbi:MAG: HAMP domain-containing histidine kinase [Prevotellaceae bacterium]|nr:HAMP domain-containing histidine kinase [Prevotellaceae bacterium]